jgi:sodium-dependent dicarboxylate transporter 2/3/5
LTEITSNTATTALLMPVLAAAAIGADVDPRLLMVPAAMSASCAFMLPVATGPNAVIFASGHVSIKDMAREGLAMNFIGAAVLTAVCYFALVG